MEKNKKFKKDANKIIDQCLDREDHISEFIKDTEKMILVKLNEAYKLGFRQALDDNYVIYGKDARALLNKIARRDAVSEKAE